MLKNNLMVLAICLAGATANGAFAQEQKTNVPGNDRTLTFEMLVKQYNFPVKKNTGNLEKDQQAYAEAKSKWVAANRELYTRYNREGDKKETRSRQNSQPVLSPSR